jgi:hypothetical protein
MQLAKKGKRDSPNYSWKAIHNLNLDYATVFSLAPYINEDVITIIGVCFLIGAMAKSAQVGKLKAQKKVWCFILAFLSTLLIAGNISNALESMHSKTLILSYLRIQPSNKKFIGRSTLQVSRTRLLNTPIHIRRSNNFRKFIQFYAYTMTPRLYSTNITKTALSARGRTLFLVPWGNNLGSTVGKYIRMEERTMQVFPREIRGALVGLLLWGGSLDKTKQTSVNVIFRLKQSLTHSLFVWSVFNILSPYCYDYPFFTSLMSQGRRNYNMQMYTRALPCFTELHNKFYVYNNGRYHKILPDNIYELLSLEALALWLMLAGNYRNSSSILISTPSYAIKEIVIILNVLIIKYSFECSIIIKKNKYHILISGESFLALLSKLVMINGEDKISLGHELKQAKWTNKREDLLKVPRFARAAADQPFRSKEGRSFLKTITRLGKKDSPGFLYVGPISFPGSPLGNERGTMCNGNCILYKIFLGDSSHVPKGLFANKVRHERKELSRIPNAKDFLDHSSLITEGLSVVEGLYDTRQKSVANIQELLEGDPFSKIKLRKRNIDVEKFQRHGIDQQVTNKLYQLEQERSQRQEIDKQVINKLTNKEWVNKRISQFGVSDLKFLEWIRGFSEGDGCFYLSEGRSIFSIHLHMVDLPLLIEIKTKLNLGTITINSKSSSATWRVSSEREILLLIEIFNGNIYLTKRQSQFDNWVNNYIRKTKVDIELKPHKFKPSLNNGWLAGFIDAEGSFKVSVSKSNNYFKISQVITVNQKDADEEFLFLSKLMKGRFTKERGYSMVVVSYSFADTLINYLIQNKLSSVKAESMEKWVEIFHSRRNNLATVDYSWVKQKAAFINQSRKLLKLRMTNS